MHYLRFAVVLSALTLVGLPLALAGVSGVVKTNVTLLVQPDDPACGSISNPCTYKVTYTTAANGSIPALKSYVGYEVAITNTGKNTVNKVTFTGTLSISAPNETASFLRADGATCVTTPSGATNKTSISCALGTLTSGQSVPKFQIFFNSPIRNTSGFNVSDAVSFSGITYYSETTNGGQPSPKNSQNFWGPANGDASNPPTAGLGTPNPTKISTTIPTSTQSQLVFTGDGFCGIVSGVPFTTSVVVPPTAFTTASIALSSNSNGCQNFQTCYQSQITIPGSFSPYLQIVLRAGGTNILAGDIGSVQLNYTGDDPSPPPGSGWNTWPVPVLACSNSMPNSGVLDGLPCLAASQTYYAQTVPPARQCFEWTLLNHKNGSYRVF